MLSFAEVAEFLHGRSINKIHKKINSINFHLQQKGTNKKVGVRDVDSTIISNAEVPVVSKKSIAKKNKTGDPIDCPRCNYHWLHNAKGKYVTCPKCSKHIVLKR